MRAVAGSGRDVSRVRWAGWSAAVAAALTVFGLQLVPGDP